MQSVPACYKFMVWSMCEEDSLVADQNSILSTEMGEHILKATVEKLFTCTDTIGGRGRGVLELCLRCQQF